MNPTIKRSNHKQKRLREAGTLNPHPEKVTDELFRERSFFDRADLLQVKYEMLRCVEKVTVPCPKRLRISASPDATFTQFKSNSLSLVCWGWCQTNGDHEAPTSSMMRSCGL